MFGLPAAEILQPGQSLIEVPSMYPAFSQGSGGRFNRHYKSWAPNWAPNWAAIWAKFSTRALEVETCLKTPNMTWAQNWARTRMSIESPPELNNKPLQVQVAGVTIIGSPCI